MTTSELQPTSAFVWVWLPGSTDPVVAGRVQLLNDQYVFTYGQGYLNRDDKIPLYLPELPLTAGFQEPSTGLEIAGALADAGPDSWGRRVVQAKRAQSAGEGRREGWDSTELNLITYFLESGSDRIGGLDFQHTPTDYVPRRLDHAATLNDLIDAADRVQKGLPLSPVLEEALLQGTSIGGARPKAIIEDGDRTLIAKFSATTDLYPVVKAEAVAMDLARRVGVHAAASRVTSAAGKDVLLVERFDRPNGGRALMVSALTILGRPEMLAHRATYPELAEEIRHRFTNPVATLRELFTRIVVNIAVGNTDDHLRNHAAFWNGADLTLTPAYDIAPQPRSGTETNQALAIGPAGDRRSRIAVARTAAAEYHLTDSDANDIIDHVVSTIRSDWNDAADNARLTQLERDYLWRRQILNDSIFYDD